MTDLVLIILAVDDVAASRAFYRAAFDWSLAVETPVYVELLMPNGLRLGLYERHSYAGNTGELPVQIPTGALAPTELYLHTDDIDSAMERIKSAGARELSPLSLRSWGDEAAYFADPSGNVLVLARTA